MTTEPMDTTNENNKSDHFLYDKRLKSAAQELIKYGVLEASHKPNLYRSCVHQAKEIEQILSPLDLEMQIDDVRGLVFLSVAKDENENENNFVNKSMTETGNTSEDENSIETEHFINTEHLDDWQHPLVRRQRMNLEQSLMVAILRQHFVAHELDAGVGDHRAIVHLDELLPQLNQFLGTTGSETKEDKRLRLLLEQLKGYGLVSEIDDNEKVTIKPLIAHVANPENLQRLVAALKKHLKSQQKEK